MKIPLKSFLLEPSEELKVFKIYGDVVRSPIDVDVSCLSEKYGFDPLYDRFRFWSTFYSSEDKHIHEIEPCPISPPIPALTIRKLDVEQDWMVFGQIWAEGSFQFLGNDDHVAMEFMKGVFENPPPTTETNLDLNCGWEGGQALIGYFLGGLTGALGWLFGQEDNKTKYDELYVAYKRFFQRGKTLTKDM